VLDHASLREHFPGHDADDPNVSGWLNALENENELVVFLCESTLTDWTRKAIRQADQVIVAVAGPGPNELNPVEEFAFSIHPPARRRLVLVHERRQGAVEGTAAWLRDREVAMHHQVALEDDRDVKSLHRFLTGRALGFVAAGGGGFGPAHIGIYKAFMEHGVQFDILGGTSVGAAVLAGFALLKSPEEVDLAAHDIFVISKGFKHFTLPRYALLDHIVFDEALRRAFMGIAIEDAWRPYFAVTTLLDGSSPIVQTKGAHVGLSGPVPPGRTVIQLVAEMPTDTGTLAVAQTFPAALDRLTILVRKVGDTKLTSPSIERQQDFPSNGETVIGAMGGKVPAGKTIELTLTDLPHHSIVPRYTALALGGVIVLGGVWFSTRKNEVGARDAERKRLIARREKLFGELLKIERERRNGRGDERSATRREELMAQLEHVYGALDDPEHAAASA